jgi:hypothetical protein
MTGKVKIDPIKVSAMERKIYAEHKRRYRKKADRQGKGKMH